MTNEALRTLLPIAGWPETRAESVHISGRMDPILPTPFRITETSTAALAAVGLAVSDLWELRTGRGQRRRARRPPGHRFSAQWQVHANGRRPGVHGAQCGDGRLSG